MLYALVIFIGTNVYTIDDDLSWADCQRAISVSIDGDVMECVKTQKV